MKRIFTAVDLSEAARNQVSGYIENLRRAHRSLRVGWEKTEKLHLTLNFFGDVNEMRLQQINSAAAAAARLFKPFALQISGTEVFPSPRKPRVLWLGIKEAENSLTQMQTILEKKCEQAGFAFEKRDFKPHLTIGRLREPARSLQLTREHLARNIESGAFQVSEIVVYESRITATGSIYKVVAKHKLSAGN